jgi:hypothetical protein
MISKIGYITYVFSKSGNFIFKMNYFKYDEIFVSKKKSFQ